MQFWQSMAHFKTSSVFFVFFLSVVFELTYVNYALNIVIAAVYYISPSGK